MAIVFEYICHVVGEGKDVVDNINYLLPAVFALSQQVPNAAVAWTRNFLSTLHENIQSQLWQPFPKLDQLIVFQVEFLDRLLPLFKRLRSLHFRFTDSSCNVFELGFLAPGGYTGCIGHVTNVGAVQCSKSSKCYSRQAADAL